MIVVRSPTMGKTMALRFKLASTKRKPLRQVYGFQPERSRALLINLRYRTLPFKARECGIPRFTVCMRASIVVETIVAILILPFWVRPFYVMINRPKMDLLAAQEQARDWKISGWNTRRLAIGLEREQMAW